jgi:hypothetical protein
MKELLLITALALLLLYKKKSGQSPMVSVAPAADSRPADVARLLTDGGLPPATCAEVKAVVENVNRLYADGRQSVREVVGAYIPTHNAAQGSCMASVAQALCLNVDDKIPATCDNLKTLTIALLSFEGKSVSAEDFATACAAINHLFNQ